MAAIRHLHSVRLVTFQLGNAISHFFKRPLFVYRSGELRLNAGYDDLQLCRALT